MIQIVKHERSSLSEDAPWQPIELITLNCSWGEAWYRVLVVNRLAPDNRVYGLACCWKHDKQSQRQLGSVNHRLEGQPSRPELIDRPSGK
ncbi:hypothetical protein IQ268_07125 [Oculatella sp. LEGE 06141]|uniref:hypothetical protein n=1 Tax=Oculatella sp. LEGE 06141 TaxID=1828648 RepID=UPI001880CC37|nr:hypothetical protein [Oculatella sp. LEGE 06141]MBE9178359.1 hypothetical protein [Oculatella sp. LEGE 06141]